VLIFMIQQFVKAFGDDVVDMNAACNH
jgi:hypothetical protein